MKLLSIISLFTILFGSGKRECIINEKGLNSIIVDSSRLKEVTTEFGEMKRDKEWQKSIEFALFGNYKYLRVFKKHGIVFYAEQKKGKKIINDIILTDGCPCETVEGIRIGSSYQELSAAFGQPYFNNDKRKPSRSYEPNMYYELIGGGKRILQITYNNFYITMSSTDTTVAKIKRIRIL